jgi:hypothetical protein
MGAEQGLSGAKPSRQGDGRSLRSLENTASARRPPTRSVDDFVGNLVQRIIDNLVAVNARSLPRCLASLAWEPRVPGVWTARLRVLDITESAANHE